MAEQALTEDNIPKGGIAGFIMPDKDFAVLEAENAKNELGTAGIAEFNDVARRMASYGRFGDDTVAHVQTGEIIVPRRLIEKSPELRESIFQHLRDQGVTDPERYVVGSSDNSINPETGLMEFGFFSNVFNGVKKTLKKVAGFVLPAVGTMVFGPVWGAALGTGVATLINGGDIGDALKAGVTAGAIGGIGSFAGGALSGQTRGFAGGMQSLGRAASPSNLGAGFRNISNMFSGEKGAFTDPFKGNIVEGPAFDNEKVTSNLVKTDLTVNNDTKGSFLNKFFPKNELTLESIIAKKFPDRTLATITGTQLEVAKSILAASKPSFLRQYGPSVGLGLGALALGGGFKTKEGEKPNLSGGETGQSLIDKDPEKYIVQNLDPYYRPQYAASGGQIFPRRTGGIMPDEGIPNKDSVKAMVMPGEFIMTTDAVRGAGGGNLNTGINNMYSVMRNLENVGRRVA
jgi:hypothetical protein